MAGRPGDPRTRCHPERQRRISASPGAIPGAGADPGRYCRDHRARGGFPPPHRRPRPRRWPDRRGPPGDGRGRAVPDRRRVQRVAAAGRALARHRLPRRGGDRRQVGNGNTGGAVRRERGTDAGTASPPARGLGPRRRRLAGGGGVDIPLRPRRPARPGRGHVRRRVRSPPRPTGMGRLAVTLGMVAAVAVGWRRVRPARLPETWAWA